ncbi:hypothetical protein EsDP_00001304 [Epichloe bromicola]|uniref:Uncharacterized protein n=1 Tax=Epichloe bromicola TaxID=79588 RepID=A0ABQ0CHG7_9HYPO
MTDSDMSYLYTIGGYAAVFGIGYAAYRISTRKANRRAPATTTKAVKSAPIEARKGDRKKKQRLESFASEAQEALKVKASAADPAPRPRPAVKDASDDDGVDNREFARQLAKAKEGTKFASKAEGSKQKEKSVKQSQANKINSVVSDEKPLDAGADADDDQSPTESPETRPADIAGVSDMLEPAPVGPSVLRITDADKVKEKKPKVTKVPEKTETKKQRQNRKKAEAAKDAREEAEKERKAMEEKQRRAARIAEGRAAKDGSQFLATNEANSWTKGAPNGANAVPFGDENVLYQPLDTQEKSTVSAAPLAKKPAATKPEDTWISSLPSEEEQMEMLKDDADEWSTVPAKTSKKGKKSNDSGDETSKQPIAQPQQAAAAPQKAAKSATSQSFGSFSALNDDAAAEEEEEEEWDV